MLLYTSVVYYVLATKTSHQSILRTKCVTVLKAEMTGVEAAHTLAADCLDCQLVETLGGSRRCHWLSTTQPPNDATAHSGHFQGALALGSPGRASTRVEIQSTFAIATGIKV